MSTAAPPPARSKGQLPFHLPDQVRQAERTQTGSSRHSGSEGAERVCASADLPTEHVLDGVSHLVAQSILLTEQRAGRVRYRMLETIREYGRERLGESGEESQLRQRHRDHYLDLVEQIIAQWCGPEQADGLRQPWLDSRSASG